VITPAQCGEKAEAILGTYVADVGAYGDADAVAKVLELLISKAALGIAMTSGEDHAHKVLMRTSMNVQRVIEGSRACAS
jgi:hypothetical protein